MATKLQNIAFNRWFEIRKHELQHKYGARFREFADKEWANEWFYRELTRSEFAQYFDMNREGTLSQILDVPPEPVYSELHEPTKPENSIVESSNMELDKMRKELVDAVSVMEPGARIGVQLMRDAFTPLNNLKRMQFLWQGYVESPALTPEELDKYTRPVTLPVALVDFLRTAGPNPLTTGPMTSLSRIALNNKAAALWQEFEADKVALVLMEDFWSRFFDKESGFLYKMSFATVSYPDGVGASLLRAARVLSKDPGITEKTAIVSPLQTQILKAREVTRAYLARERSHAAIKMAYIADRETYKKQMAEYQRQVKAQKYAEKVKEEAVLAGLIRWFRAAVDPCKQKDSFFASLTNAPPPAKKARVDDLPPLPLFTFFAAEPEPEFFDVETDDEEEKKRLEEETRRVEAALRLQEEERRLLEEEEAQTVIAGSQPAPSVPEQPELTPRAEWWAPRIQRLAELSDLASKLIEEVTKMDPKLQPTVQREQFLQLWRETDAIQEEYQNMVYDDNKKKANELYMDITLKKKQRFALALDNRSNAEYNRLLNSETPFLINMLQQPQVTNKQIEKAERFLNSTADYPHKPARYNELIDEVKRLRTARTLAQQAADRENVKLQPIPLVVKVERDFETESRIILLAGSQASEALYKGVIKTADAYVTVDGDSNFIKMSGYSAALQQLATETARISTLIERKNEMYELQREAVDANYSKILAVRNNVDSLNTVYYNVASQVKRQLLKYYAQVVTWSVDDTIDDQMVESNASEIRAALDSSELLMEKLRSIFSDDADLLYEHEQAETALNRRIAPKQYNVEDIFERFPSSGIRDADKFVQRVRQAASVSEDWIPRALQQKSHGDVLKLIKGLK